MPLLTRPLIRSPRMRLYVRIIYSSIVLMCVAALALTLFVSYTLDLNNTGEHELIAPFPVGVIPDEKRFVNDPTLDIFIAYAGMRPVQRVESFMQLPLVRALIGIAQSTTLTVTVPNAKVLVVYGGERKEEVAEDFAAILHWSTSERLRFLALLKSRFPDLVDGYIVPDRYIVPRHATPAFMADTLADRFDQDIAKRYALMENPPRSLKETLIIASLIEREGYDLPDMRTISGVIWSRLFIDMPLQLDATLQYARASQLKNGVWWPKPRPQDKNINSPYNTYQHKGLPPEPIANPSLEAILAALAPQESGCLYYFHENRHTLHCSATYEDHVAKLRTIYGRGK